MFHMHRMHWKNRVYRDSLLKRVGILVVTVTGIFKDPAQRARDQKQRGALHFAVKAGQELCTLTMWRDDLEGMMMIMMIQ